MLKVLLIDDHWLVRSALRLIMTERFGEIEFRECQDGACVLSEVKKHIFDLVITDLVIPSAQPGAVLNSILRHQLGVPVLVFTMFPEVVNVQTCLKMGIKGFVSKECPDEEILKAISAVLAGQQYVGESLTDR